MGGIRNASLCYVDYKIGLVFAIPAIIAVYLTRAYLVPSIPLEIMRFGSFSLTKDVAIMLFFALIMLAASVSMIRNRKHPKRRNTGAASKFNIIGILQRDP